MSIWYISDTHFDHANILHLCKRPFQTVQEMDKVIVDRWNSVVKDNDLVIHLGDFGDPKFRDPRFYLQKLKGNIILIKGNHDKTRVLKKCGFSHVLVGTLNMDFEYKGKKYKVAIKHRPQTMKKTRFIICAHVHEKWKIKEDKYNVYINIGVDQWDYYPVALTDLLSSRNTLSLFFEPLMKFIVISISLQPSTVCLVKYNLSFVVDFINFI